MDYYYQFHKHQHYFLCHDILEDAWKSQNTFSKHDAVVSLILFATANYLLTTLKMRLNYTLISMNLNNLL